MGDPWVCGACTCTSMVWSFGSGPPTPQKITSVWELGIHFSLLAEAGSEKVNGSQ